jgi:hypothetical protein
LDCSTVTIQNTSIFTAQFAACFYWFLLDLHFDHDDGSGMFLWNSRLYPDYTVLQPRWLYSSIYTNKTKRSPVYMLTPHILKLLFLSLQMASHLNILLAGMLVVTTFTNDNCFQLTDRSQNTMAGMAWEAWEAHDLHHPWDFFSWPQYSYMNKSHILK